MTRLPLAALALAGLVTAAAAQPTGGGPRAVPAYDPKTVETLSAEVLRVDRIPSPRGRGAGLHLLVKTDAGAEVVVHLGPASYVEGHGLSLAPKDHVRITGSRVEQAGTPVLIAAQVQMGDRTVVLRDAAGIPAWSAGRRGRARGADTKERP